MTCFRFSYDLCTTDRRFVLASMLVWALGFSGCHQRAYNELYVENMAGEIRLLEDRIYEYDAEYRVLENELRDLQARNGELEARLRQSEQERSQPRSPSRPRAPSEAPSRKSTPEPAPPELAPPELAPPESKPSQPPKNAPPKESLKRPPVEELKLDVETPSNPPALPPVPPGNTPVSPGDTTSPDVEELLPKKSGTQLPGTQLPAGASTAPRGLPPEIVQASFEERRIDAPVLPAVAGLKAPPVVNGNPEPIDPRVREIDFHPGLCRGLNKDDQPGEEGIALVLVPRNRKGSFVPGNGKVTIVMEESVEGETTRLGQWDFSSVEIAEQIEPVGDGQGIHLELLWKDKTPTSHLIDVYVRYTDELGITAVNHRPIHLRKSSPGQSTWTPR